MSATVLRVSGASKRFGGLQALNDVGIQIDRGQIYGLIGPNGAGKTTFFNVITGLYPPDSGDFILAGKAYKPAAVHQVAREGIARTFQNIRLFPDMTALENVMVGRHVRTNSALIGAVFRTRHFKTEEKPSANGRVNCWPMWASSGMPTSAPARCRMATSAAWKSPALWPPIRNCWRSTSQRPA